MTDELTDTAIVTEEEQQSTLRAKQFSCLNDDDNATSPAGWLFCPRVWDGILCWRPTPPGEMSVQPCPLYIVGFNHLNNATKKCQDDGSWYQHQSTNNTWTNYTQCSSEHFTRIVIKIPQMQNVSPLVLGYVDTVKNISQFGYAISFVTLLVAFCILASFKRLRCPRNLLHMHLFVSFMMRSFFFLLKAALFVSGVALPSDFQTKEGQMYLNSDIQKTWTCKIILTGWTYFQLANYIWLFMEGLYLHNLIFLALFSDTSSICIYTIFGWGLPLLCVAIWVLFRILFENELCWTTNNNIYIYGIIKVPIIISIFLNLCMFINIIRVVMVKLRASMTEETRRLRRWAKSTLVLVPLFGVQYALSLVVSAVQYERIQILWLFFDQLFGSFQGCVVAILYCFMNNEVQEELRRLKAKKIRICRNKSKKNRSSADLGELQVMNDSVVKFSNLTKTSSQSASSNDNRLTDKEISLMNSKKSSDSPSPSPTIFIIQNDDSFSNAFHPHPLLYQCSNCGRKYQTKTGIVQHQKFECGKEPGFACKVCNKKFRYKTSLKRHLICVHNASNQELRTHNQSKPNWNPQS